MYLEELIPGVCLESDKLECKSKLNREDVVGWLKSIAGFANAAGGAFYIGVEDKSNKLIGFDKKNADNERNYFNNQVNEHLTPRPQMSISFLRYEINGTERFIIRVEVPESAVKPVILKYKNIPSIFMRRDGFTNGATYEEIIEMSVKSKNVQYDILVSDEKYNADLYRAEPFSETLCVSAENVALDGFTDEPSLHAAGLFNLNERSVEYGYRLYDKLYPASTTKLMTAYLALKYGKLEDMVTVTDSVTGFAIDEVVCGLYPGGQVKLYDLLCGLLLKSGNDCGVAIAEYISGSVEAFAELMNEEAKELGATGTHFVNPHGLHEDDHYTTAYDLYLIFNACIQNDTFKEIISMSSYTMSIGDAAGNTHSLEVLPTNYYSLGKTEAPEGIKVFGGKTGTTDQAGCCVILYSEDMEAHPYISVIMGAEDKAFLYQEMNRLLEAEKALSE